MYHARTAVLGLCPARKGSFVLFVISLLLGQMHLDYSALLPRFDDSLEHECLQPLLELALATKGLSFAN